MENTQIENTTDVVIEDINEETLLSLDETLELDQEQTEIAEGKCKKEGEDMEDEEESDEDEKEDEEECEDDEEEMTEGSLDNMSLEQLWDNHEEYSYYADQGYGHGVGSIKNGKAAADAIFKFVKSKFGAKVADDMEDASQAYVSDAEYDGTSESKNKRKSIRKKHGLNEAKKMTEAPDPDKSAYNKFKNDKELMKTHTVQHVGGKTFLLKKVVSDRDLKPDNYVVVSVSSETEAQKIKDKVKENNKKESDKIKRAQVAVYKRKDGFKVYIKGEPQAVSKYKSLGESLILTIKEFLTLERGMLIEEFSIFDDLEYHYEAKKVSEEAEVSSDEEFTSYAKGILKAAHGDNYDEAKAMAAIEGILKKADGDYGSAIGMITSGLGEEEMEDEKEVEMKEETEEVIEENTISIDTSDITRLVESETGLTEEFKEKATTIFEAAVKSKLKETEETLKESYAVALIEEVETIKEELVEKIDNYLTYAVESWVEDNKVAIEGGLRTQIAENFIQSLKTVFVENYIEVPESKQDLVAEMETSIAQLQNESAELENTVLALNEKVNSLTREKVISESTTDLADTQAEKLKSLLEDIECTSETSFRKKVATIKEFYLNGAAVEETLTEEASSDNSSYVTTETIVENETEVEVSPAMKNYLTALSRLSKATTANVPVVG